MLKNEAYIIESYRVSEEQYLYVRKLTAGLNEPTRRLFCHILASTLLKLAGLGDGVWVPVASELIKAKLRGASWQALEKRGLIEATGYSIKEGRSREYQVVSDMIDAFAGFTQGLSAEEVIYLACVNLFTGRAMRAADKNVLYDDSGNTLPKPYRDAVETIYNNGAVFYLKRVEAHVRALEAEYESAMAEREKAEVLGFGGQYLQERKEACAKARSRWLNDYLCFQYILQQKPVQVTDDLWVYPPAYKATMSGRATHLRGGFQSCSKEMKGAAFNDVPDLHNVDLEASQVNGLIQQFEIAGRNPSWLLTYRDTPNQKTVYAESASMSVKCWKDCLLALCMGGTLPRRFHNLDTRKNSIIDFVRRECNGNVAEMMKVLKQFRAVVEPLADELAKWHEWLVTDYYYASRKAGRGGWYIANKVGIKLNMSALFENYPIWEVKAKVASFVLTGQEAAFIHTLTVLGAKYGFKAIGNEHDGLIVIGAIPKAAIEEAAKLSGLQNAKLVEKRFPMRADLHFVYEKQKQTEATL